MLTLGLGTIAAAACSSDPAGTDVTSSGGLPGVDAGSSSGNPVKPDSGTSSSGGSSGGIDSGPPDTTAPLAVSDLAAAPAGTTSIALTWTAPADPPGGNVSSYEIRRSLTNITSTIDFNAGTLVSAATPKPQGTADATTVTGLTPETTYYFAIRAKDAAGNVGPISNIATATTKARATLLVSEVAMLNAAAQDFVELVVTKAGNVKDLTVKQAQSPLTIHTFADLDVALGDRIVVHMTNLPGPANFAQEDVAKSKTASTETTTGQASDTAWDVYSTAENLVGTDNVISVVDGTTVMDAVAYSDRDGDAAAAAMTGFAAAKTATAWGFTADPVDATNDCATQREAVAVSTGIGNSNGACGRMQTNIAAGFSINRINTTDTGTKKDWYVAAQTPGAANSAVPAPTLLNAVAQSLTTVDLRFDQEIDSATVTAGAFTGGGVTVNAAAVNEPAIITLTTTSQTGLHTIGIDAAVKTIYGASVPSSTSFCVYEPLGGLVQLTELNPIISGSAGELIELQATRAGNIGGFSVRLNATAAAVNGSNLANFPAGLCVAVGDIVVVHVDPPAAIVGTGETTSKSQEPTATFSTHFDAAWDVRGTTTALPNSDSVVYVRDAGGTYVDAVAYTDGDANNTENASFIASLQYAQSLTLWTPADCTGQACSDTSTPTAEGVSASHAGAATTVAGNSLRKSAVSAARTAASWSVGASSFGTINP